MSFHIPYYEDYLSSKFKSHLLKDARPLFGIEGLSLVGETGGLESKESLDFLVELYNEVFPELKNILNQRQVDRKFIDEKTSSSIDYNVDLKIPLSSSDYKTVIGEKDTNGRIVIGPEDSDYMNAKGDTIAPIPKYLEGFHVTLFGPPDSEKMCINAMNAFHRKLKDEPAVVQELLKDVEYTPKWGADNEDSKTPLHSDLKSAGINLSKSLDHEIELTDSKGKEYKLAKDHLAHAIKRFPGLALPSFFMFYNNEPIPLHIYDFALHAFKNSHNPEAMVFYVPKLENEEEAKYIRNLMRKAEELIQIRNPNYKIGTIRLMIVLENPRAVFRVNEIIDNLYPYFVGASLGWHDYLGSTARLFKNDPNYRIPVKADPDIVIKYIKASHDLLSDVVGARGGIKVGGMYGILPTTYDLKSSSLQVTIVGYIRDVITQLKRNLNGFWVAHPDFVRLGMAIVEAWKIRVKGDATKLETLVTSLLDEKYHEEIMSFINGPDIKGLDQKDPMYARSLIVADIGESNIISNNHPDEIRYNVFQSLQYITDWLSGNGCVALPTVINDTAVRIMDDLATAERSRWEVWHELHHNRFDLYDFLKIAHEEMHFIRKDLSDGVKQVQVKLTDENKKWYPVAMNLMIKLMTDKKPAEFATELLLPFTVDEIRNSTDPWAKANELDQEKFHIDEKIKAFNYYFDICGELSFAKELSKESVTDFNKIERLILNFDENQINQAAHFHGDIGESKKNLDDKASKEQEGVNDDESVIKDLLTYGKKYKERFGFKYLIFATGKTGSEMLKLLKGRLDQTKDHEISEAKLALFQITKNRIEKNPYNSLHEHIESLKKKLNVKGIQFSITKDAEHIQTYSSGSRDDSNNVDNSTYFEIASLSKTVGTLIAIEYFKSQNIQLYTSVNKLLKIYGSEFKISSKTPEVDAFSNEVNLMHLMSHSALNMHYVNGVPTSDEMPAIEEFLFGNEKYGYEPIELMFKPGSSFQYSGAGFILLEYLVELVSKRKFNVLMKDYLENLGIDNISAFPIDNYAHGFRDNGEVVESTRFNFPMIAAGMMGTSHDMLEFCSMLGKAYQNLSGLKNVSHDSAVKMLYGVDRGSRQFMNCYMGLGVFIAEAGENKLMIHQGANDGYRSLYLYCFDGPDYGKGFSIFSNGELNSVLLNSYISQLLLKELDFSGIDFEKFKRNFEKDSLKEEEIVNLGYKTLVFDAFLANESETYPRIKKDILSEYNHLVLSEILYVSNDKFASATNLISAYEPEYDPTFFGRQGKVMDSWESARHNHFENELLHLKLKKEFELKYAFLSTKFHYGNQVEFVEVFALVDDEWKVLIPKISMDGHSYRYLKLPLALKTKEIKVKTYPDGGFTRLGLYSEIPSEHISKFKDIKESESVRYQDEIPMPKESINITVDLTSSEIKENIDRIPDNTLINIASSAFGAKILNATDEHYSPASRVISPFAPADMFDGLENARSRKENNYESVEIELAMKKKIDHIVFDFTYFVNNNPEYIEVDGYNGEDWVTMIEKDWVKPYRANQKLYPMFHRDEIEKIRVRIFPDGGINRIKVYAKK